MRNLLALIGAAVVTFSVAGWYLGWYKVDAAPSLTDPGHQKVTVDVDARKVKTDGQKFEQKLQRAVEEAKVDTGKVPVSGVIPAAKVSQ